MFKTFIRILFRRVEVPVEWVHEVIDILDNDRSGFISLSELAVTLRTMWRKMKKANRIARV